MSKNSAWSNPSKVVAVGFAAALVTGAFLLMLPAATTGHGNAPFLKALFTSTSAICVTGLAIVGDTEGLPDTQTLFALLSVAGVSKAAGSSTGSVTMC